MALSFFDLTPDLILDSVEDALDLVSQNRRATGRNWILNSIENRVYEIELEDDTRIIGKFYRPQRWNIDQILEEHKFSQKLADSEVPALTPLQLTNGLAPTLASVLGSEKDSSIYFALFPKFQGKSHDELSLEDLKILGRFLGRMHQVGSAFDIKHRLQLNTENYGWNSLDYLMNSDFMNDNVKSRYESIVQPLLEVCEERLNGIPLLAIHGDCHLGNILWQQGQPLLLDFDDMLLGPAVQDIWMICNGREEMDLKKREVLLDAYETFMPFDYSQLDIIEALRALRMVHYSAWIAKRWDDPSFPKLFPNFASDSFWFEEIQALSECRELLL